jgi:hypothetical protein
MSALPLEADIARRVHQRPLSARSGRDACGEKVGSQPLLKHDEGRHLMHKLILAAAVALILSGSLVWKAEATPGPNMGMLPATEFSPVIKAGCGGPGRCPWGRYWVCRPRGCWCAPCGGYYRPYVYRRPYVYPRPYWRRW